MQTSHVISDLILAATGIFVFIKYLSHLKYTNTILWESFVLSVSAAAIFGAVGFMGYEKSNMISLFFQQLATITGGVGLVAASYGLIKNIDFNGYSTYFILGLGFLLYVIAEGFGILQVRIWTPIICMALVVLIAILGLVQGRYKPSIWLLVGVIFFALGSFRKDIFGDGDATIDIFHYLTAAGLLSIGMANASRS
jgi:hypothetical protein